MRQLPRWQRLSAAKTLIGTGTVTAPSQADKVKAAGGQLIVSPDTNVGVICLIEELGLVSMPGFATASEAFTAIDAGADALKMFPARAGGAPTLSALKSVLPADIAVYALGGVGPANMAEFVSAGADGFGLGTHLYQPGDSAADVAEKSPRSCYRLRKSVWLVSRQLYWFRVIQFATQCKACSPASIAAGKVMNP